MSHLGERDCSIQRRHQKLIEIAPSPGLPQVLRERIAGSAVELARAVDYDNIGTFEFLVDATELNDGSSFAFIEANPRLQVEHTVTEEVTGVDLVCTQLQLAGGRSLAELGLEQDDVPTARGFALQVRVNMETMRADGVPLPASGVLTAYDSPSGPGIRVDTFGYTGYRTTPHFDSLLAKLIGHSPSASFADVVNRTYRALCEFRVEGVATNISFLQCVLAHPEFRAGRFSTSFVGDNVAELVASASTDHRRLYVEQRTEPVVAGVRVDPNDPLAVLTYGKSASAGSVAPAADRAPAPAVGGPLGALAVEAPLQGTVVSLAVAEGSAVRSGQQLVVMESMKMEHEIMAQTSGIVRQLAVAVGDTIYQGHPLLFIEEAEVDAGAAAAEEEVDLDEIRPDLREVLDRRELTRDAARPEAVARRRATKQRTARENIEDLCDPETFVEYGPLVLAAQRRRRSLEELIQKSPADGMVTGIGSINGDLFHPPASYCAVMSYDYTVFAGTQGQQNHAKTDRMIFVAEQGRMPMVLFAEGGGGRPGDTDGGGGYEGGTRTFARFATLSGHVPMVGITSGRCFAGNASWLGCCDVIIATANSNIGMGGPAMIEGGGLGVFAPEDIGGMDVQVPNGVVDIAVADEGEAVSAAKRYLSFFQGSLSEWNCPDQRAMRRIVPENRLRVYNVRSVIDTLADTGSVLELRRRIRHRHGDSAGQGRGATARCNCEQPDAPRRRHRLGRL